MRLGVITDEVTQDFEEALQFASEFGLDCVELRSAWEKGPFDYTDEDIDKIKALSDRYGIPVTAISSPVFKCEYNETNIKEHTQAFERLAKYAVKLGASTIRCFDFFKDESVTLKMIKDAYMPVCDICKQYGITVVIESEPTTNSQCCEDIAAVVKAIDNPGVRALYDPGNNIYASTEVPYPAGYEYIRDTLIHVHVKDAVLEDGKAVGVAVGSGLVDYPGIFAALAGDGYDGDIMLETHYRPKGALDEATLKNPKGSAISENGLEASRECMTELKKLINKYYM